jgi:hypothetical protein
LLKIRDTGCRKKYDIEDNFAFIIDRWENHEKPVKYNCNFLQFNVIANKLHVSATWTSSGFL